MPVTIRPAWLPADPAATFDCRFDTTPEKPRDWLAETHRIANEIAEARARRNNPRHRPRLVGTR